MELYADEVLLSAVATGPIVWANVSGDPGTTKTITLNRPRDEHQGFVTSASLEII